jgi:hypothetical protein
VTVVGRSLTAVDVDATAAFALGADGERWLAARATGPRSSYARTRRPARSDVRPPYLRRTADLPLPFTVGSVTATANPLRPVNPGGGGSYRSGT